MKTYEELAKGVSGMTEKEILRQEMEILLLDSRRNSVKEIAPLALAMTEIYDRLAAPDAAAHWH